MRPFGREVRYQNAAMRHAYRIRVDWYKRVKSQGCVCLASRECVRSNLLRRWWIALKNSSKPWLFSDHQFLYKEFILIWHKHFHYNESVEININLLRVASEYHISELTLLIFSNNSSVVESCCCTLGKWTNIHCAVHCLTEWMSKALWVHSVGITPFIATIRKAVGWVVALWVWREDLAVGFQVVGSLEHMSYKRKFREVDYLIW